MMKGWHNPAYFEKEWRIKTRMQGEVFAIDPGGLLEEGAADMSTGGKIDLLSDVDGPLDERFKSFYAIKSNDRKSFDSIFSGELLDDFFTSAYSTIQYEMNVTPRSVNIYTTYCSRKIQKRNIGFLRKLAAKIELFAGEKQGVTKNLKRS